MLMLTGKSFTCSLLVWAISLFQELLLDCKHLNSSNLEAEHVCGLCIRRFVPESN